MKDGIQMFLVISLAELLDVSLNATENLGVRNSQGVRTHFWRKGRCSST